ncbi:MAG TPA: Ig-like domain-containing protein, partial [Acidimicrobiia bacterium]|nr:Ig-like domain-containing protein [Acidimicrobiia bacterium]
VMPLNAAAGGHLGESGADEIGHIDLGAVRGEGPDGIANGRLRRLAAGTSAQALGLDELVVGPRVLVIVEHDITDSAVAQFLTDIGGKVYRHLGGGYSEAFVPIARLLDLESHSGVLSVSPPPRPVPLQDSGMLGEENIQPLAMTVTGEEVAKTGADVWQIGGVDGAGVKIGIIDFFDQTFWQSAQAAGEVSAPAGSFCRFGGSACNVFTVTPGEKHGTAVAEIVHEMAPGAQLYLGYAATAGDYLAVIDFFAAQGVSVISHSATWEYDGPGDGTGPAAQIIDYAAAKGIAWINAAGNFAGGGYWRGQWVDDDNDNRLDFSPGDPSLGFFCGGTLGLRWNDWGPTGRTDYDVFVFDDPGLTSLKASSENNQTTGGAAPLEHFFEELVTAGCNGPRDADFLVIKLSNPGDGTAGDVLELAVTTLLEYHSDPFSAAIPFGDSASPASLSVGAVDPPLGANAASYSSRGPSNDSRIKPDISAPSGVSNYTYGTFHGTSASAPAVAGAAALVLDADLATSPTGLTSFLKGATVDRGDSGADNTFGSGELFLGEPPPVAVDDAYSTDEDVPLNVSAPGVLDNDSDVDGDPLSVSAFDSSSVEGGTVVVDPDGSFTYTPPPDFFGTDSFSYTVTDGLATDEATVTITVAAVNDPPVAVDDAYSAKQDVSLSVSAADGVLGNDADVDGDPLTVSDSDPSSIEGGTVAVNADGSFTYTPASGFTGTDSFSYTVTDGTASDVATV